MLGVWFMGSKGLLFHLPLTPFCRMGEQVTSRLDYCNSLMFGIPKELISQLQKRQNHAARVITKWRKYDHITPVLVDLHWLPVKQRIDFKILLLTYKALNGLAPAYMRELLIPYSPIPHSPIHGKPSTHTSEMSIGVLWQEILCCSRTNTVEQFTPKLNCSRPRQRSCSTAVKVLNATQK